VSFSFTYDPFLGVGKGRSLFRKGAGAAPDWSGNITELPNLRVTTYAIGVPVESIGVDAVSHMRLMRHVSKHPPGGQKKRYCFLGTFLQIEYRLICPPGGTLHLHQILSSVVIHIQSQAATVGAHAERYLDATYAFQDRSRFALP